MQRPSAAMHFRIPAFFTALLLPWLATADPAKLPAQQRLSVASGKPLKADESPAGEAVMTIHHPHHPNGTAILIYPGGGYTSRVVQPEGHLIAKWLGNHGITGVVVEYRLPAGNSGLPLADGQQATRRVRAQAAAWKLDPARIGNMGFSAGGHLAATAATQFDRGNPQATDALAKQSCRPDFSILIYPVITMGGLTHGGSKQALLGAEPDAAAIERFSAEKQVTRDTPPTFLAHAENDTLVVPANSQVYYDALIKNQVAAEYLKLATGGHGLNGYQGAMWDQWQAACLHWLAKQKLIPAANTQ
jgi:acetyl esterase/lipase